MARKPLQLSPKTLTAIAEALFLAYTEEQAAYLGGISERTLSRLKHTELWRQIQTRRLQFEKPYRKKVMDGRTGWQGAAWMLERQYASQLSKPEVQLSLNTGANVTNNTLVVTAEVAANLRNRHASMTEEVAKLERLASTDASSSKVPWGEGTAAPAEPATDPNLGQKAGISEVPQAPTVEVEGGIRNLDKTTVAVTVPSKRRKAPPKVARGIRRGPGKASPSKLARELSKEVNTGKLAG